MLFQEKCVYLQFIKKNRIVKIYEKVMKSYRLLTLIFLNIVVQLAVCTTGLADEVRHSKVGDKVKVDKALTLTLTTKHQNYNWGDKATLDGDICSPKSVKFHPDGRKYYVNSLEGGSTVVYDAATHKKLKVIIHRFTGKEKGLWAERSGLFSFVKYLSNQDKFVGKPVESTFTHNGRYLWVTYYRRSYDINAQEPSAVAIIDTQCDSIVRMMETGPLPKMIATSADGRCVAVTHWGDNTVALIDVSGAKPADWHYVACIAIGQKLKMDFSTTTHVNRDEVSGLKLRGTVFMPDGRHLLVSCMSGSGIAVIDVERRKYVGMIYGQECNVRHMLIKNNYLYISANLPGKVQRIPLDSISRAVTDMSGRVTVKGWQTCQVYCGTRTISISPSGRYLFAACSHSSQLAIVDTKTMTRIGSTVIDSYPVGLDISPDGKTLITTSQGKRGGGGNSVNVFSVEYADYDAEIAGMDHVVAKEDKDTSEMVVCALPKKEEVEGRLDLPKIGMALAGGLIALVTTIICIIRSRKRRKDNEE